MATQEQGSYNSTFINNTLNRLRRALAMDIEITLRIKELKSAGGTSPTWFDAATTAQHLARRVAFSALMDLRDHGDDQTKLEAIALRFHQRMFNKTGILSQDLLISQQDKETIGPFIAEIHQ